jgi:uncharacterized circularly permuted ATP-grasp superfamily protein
MERRSRQGALFAGYGLGHAYDEMFDAAGEPRPQCRSLVEGLMAISPGELGQQQTEADKAFLTQGITDLTRASAR